MRSSFPFRTNRARALRSRSSSAEDRLWSHIRNRHLDGHKFVRQAPVGPYFADFLCRERKLIVEIDGATHGEDLEIACDEARTSELAGLGYRVVRVSNTDVYDNIDGVLEYLLAHLEGRIGGEE